MIHPSQDDVVSPFLLKLPVTEDGLTAETGQTIKTFLAHRHIINPISQNLFLFTKHIFDFT